MDYAKPADVVASMVEAGQKKLTLAPRDLLIRGALSGALLGAATALAFTGAVTTGQPLVGALIFPVSLVMIVLLGLELVTGSFALVPLARLEGKASWNAVRSVLKSVAPERRASARRPAASGSGMGLWRSAPRWLANAGRSRSAGSSSAGAPASCRRQ